MNQMFETQISFFRNLSATPVSVTLQEWIDLNRNQNQYSDLIVSYRNTGNQLIKKSLPHATVGGEFEKGRKLENIVRHTGWVALDIDHKDNLHLPSAAVLRDEVAKISYVAFSGLSVSGKGI